MSRPGLEHPLILSYRFCRQRDRLAPPAQVAVDKVLIKLSGGSCKLKKLSAYPGLYEIRISPSLRLIIERPFANAGTIVRSVGPHGPILRRP
ncbi:hypothetical protein BXT84_00625 [Sulfobacillus thermotolerans]|uniref:Uncharacterized protein n=1 Tax=Sulfobacillus thermotolerans TaxID=338644 RepID=A0ABN5GVW8_9FIRM|nr:hypothetical protein BXT84_00625 [Sulfobacillus thermotolerans]